MDLPGIVRYFESLSPQSLAQLPSMYADGAEFRDPFNTVRGLPAITAVYRHMFEALEGPRFTVLGDFAGAGGHVLLWDFEYRLRGVPHVIRGTSHLQLAADGRIAVHHDYWNAAELYEQVPVLGAFMRWLRRRAGTT